MGPRIYIVKYLAEAMNGSVKAENKDGFCVMIELPTAASSCRDEAGKVI